MGKRMDDDTLLTHIDHLERQATGYFSSEIQADQTRAMDYYLGKGFGTEEDGRSQVVSSDVWDVVEGLTPLVLKPFVASDDVVKFNPLGPDDEEAAKQESDYVNWVVTQKNDSFSELVSWVKTGLLQKNGVVKYWWEKSRKATIERYYGIDAEVFSAVGQEEGVEVIEHTENGDGTVDFTLRTVEEVGHPAYAVLAPEEFRIARNANSINPQKATFVQHVRKMTVSDIRAMGYDVDDDVADETTEDPQFSQLYQARRGEEDSISGSQEQVDPASREVLFKETYLDIDADGDGIAELRKVCSVAKKILCNEETEEKPFAAWSPYPQPFKFYGRCPADETIEIQQIKSTLWRQSLDNIYTINNNRVYVSGKVNLDDLIDNQIAGIVRIDGDDVGRHVVPAQITPIGQVVQPMIEYLDSAKENRTGFTRYNQGTDADSLNKTATGIRIIKQAGDSRVELVSRAFAEQGLAPLMRGIHGLCRRHATKAETMRLRGEWVNIDPRGWKTRTDMSVAVGLGTADQQMQMQGAQLLVGAQMQLLQTPSAALVQPQNVYNAHAKLVESLGYKNPESYFTSPGKAPPGPDPSKDPHFQLEAHKVMGDLEIKQQQVQIERFRAHMDAHVAMKPEPGQSDNSGPEMAKLQVDATKIRVESAHKDADRKAEAIMAQREQQFEAWKVTEQEKTKREIAALQVASAEKQTETQVASAEKQTAMSAEASEKAAKAKAVEKPAEKGPDLDKVVEGFDKLVEAMNEPKTVVRDGAGSATHIKQGDKLTPIKKDSNGRIIGV